MRINLKLRPLAALAAGLLRPPPDRTACQWADANRILPAGTAEPGPWRSDRTPYIHPFAAACADPAFRVVVLCCGSQMGKTEALLNVIGHRFDDDPAPALWIGPTQKAVESLSGDRLAKMVRSCPALLAKLHRGKQNKLTEKFFSGVRLGLAWAGSATELASHAAALVVVDEVDRMEPTAEGDPVSLALARTSTFPDGRVILVSTPTLDGASPIWARFLEGTQHRWHWPCPHCGAYFIPSFDLLRWPDKATPAEARRRAVVVCPSCGVEIEDRHRHAMNENGLYLAPGQAVVEGRIVGPAPDNDTASFWVSGLASPWRTFGRAAQLWLEAHRSGDPARRQAVKNTAFGELWTLKGDAPDWDKVWSLRGGYQSDTVPDGVRLVTAGVDVQKDRLYCVVRGFGAQGESWLIAHHEIFGLHEGGAAWERLAAVLERPYGKHRVRLALVDSGYGTDQVYAFARRYRHLCAPCKGHESLDKPVKPSRLDVGRSGKTVAGGLTLWHVDGGYFKAQIHGRIDWPPGEPGGFHLPIDATEDYCKQLVAESRVVRAGKAVWIRHGKANHYLDAEVYAHAAAHVLGAHVLRESPPAEPPPPRKEPKPGFINRPVGERWL